MKKSRFTETQIVKAIKAHEASRIVVEICREMEVTPATFYKWRKLPQILDSLKYDKVADFKLYEEAKIYRKPDHQSGQGS